MGIRQKDAGRCAVSENAKKKNDNNLQNCSSGISNRQYRYLTFRASLLSVAEIDND